MDDQLLYILCFIFVFIFINIKQTTLLIIYDINRIFHKYMVSCIMFCAFFYNTFD